LLFSFFGAPKTFLGPKGEGLGPNPSGFGPAAVLLFSPFDFSVFAVVGFSSAFGSVGLSPSFAVPTPRCDPDLTRGPKGEGLGPPPSGVLGLGVSLLSFPGSARVAAGLGPPILGPKRDPFAAMSLSPFSGAGLPAGTWLAKIPTLPATPPPLPPGVAIVRAS